VSVAGEVAVADEGDGLAALEGLDDAAAGMVEGDDLEAALFAEELEDAFEGGGGDGADDGVDGDAHGGDEGAAEFPVAVVGGEHDGAALGVADGFEMFEALDADAVAQAFGGEFLEADEVGEIFAEILEGLAGAAVEEVARGRMPWCSKMTRRFSRTAARRGG
jgi:hypothetical protein